MFTTASRERYDSLGDVTAPGDDAGNAGMEISHPGDKMIVNFSDTHAVLADMASQVQEPTTARHVLLEAVSAVHHLCDHMTMTMKSCWPKQWSFIVFNRRAI
jgi:hypothetical protein